MSDKDKMAKYRTEIQQSCNRARQNVHPQDVHGSCVTRTFP
ncbi:hypothetical protein IG631_10626 [Alternaria alternata]|nr:hypothetical protein IG631_10626 [Alternaria alternata]